MSCSEVLTTTLDVLFDFHVGVTETDEFFLTALAGFHDELLPALDFTAWYVALHL